MKPPERVESFCFENKDFRLALEPYEDYFFVHHDVYNWKPSTKKLSQAILNELADRGTLKVFAPKDSPQRIKYARIYGFEITHTLVSPHDGVEYYIMELTR